MISQLHFVFLFEILLVKFSLSSLSEIQCQSCVTLFIKENYLVRLFLAEILILQIRIFSE